MKNLILLTVMGLMALPATGKEYEATWESLKNYEAPEWYEDAKLGFWVHWGVYSVPAYGGDHASEWYGRWMYTNPGSNDEKRGQKTGQHHRDTYGDPSKFGYKDFIPMFKAEKFDAEEWADLCVRGGAKHFTMMAAHHDSFCLWDTKLSKWNSVNMGPKRDLVGEIEKAVRKKGLKFGVSNHTAWNYQFFEFNHRNKGDATDPANQDLYGNAIVDLKLAGERGTHFTQPSRRDLDRWLARTREVTVMYKPDLHYFDWGHGPKVFEPGKKEFAACYYNKAIEWGVGTFGKPEVVLNQKSTYPYGTSVIDIERGHMQSIQEMVWQTDDCVYDGHTWGYEEGVPIKPTNRIVDELMDIISKRGVLMLSFAPKADGSWPKDQKQMVYELGDWLKINGEAVYSTRPYATFRDVANVRYTRNKANNTLYATMLEWHDKVTLRQLNPKYLNKNQIKSVHLLGSSQPVRWLQTEAGLVINLPQKPDYDFAYPIRIAVKGQLPSEAAVFPSREGQVIKVSGNKTELSVSQAWLWGYGMKIENRPPGKNIGSWNSREEFPEWVMDVRHRGKYRVQALYAHPHNRNVPVVVDVDGQQLAASLPKTGDWAHAEIETLGVILLDKAGKQKLRFKPGKNWSSINLWSLSLVPIDL